MPSPSPDYGMVKNQDSPRAKLRSVDLRAVRWTRGFWAERFRQNAEVSLSHLWELAADPNWGHAFTNMRIAAGLEEGEHAGTHWQDAWIYKWLESAAVVYATSGDEPLDRRMDEVIDVVAKAQQPDGYLATQTTVRGWERFQATHHHELYTMGHLLTAACIHHRVTGKANLLAIAKRAADRVWDTFESRDPALAHFPHNPSIIMGSVELYRTTGNRVYLDLANLMIDQRGSQPGGKELEQDVVPLREETEVVGHAVFYTYLYAGAADVYMETGDETLLTALDRLWHNLVEKKMYVHGGVCPLHRALFFREAAPNMSGGQDVHEAAGRPYELPNSTAYNETCAQIGSAMWNWRMLMIDPQERYADIMERQIYNSILSGVSLDGRNWFYTNPLRWYGPEHHLLSNDAHERFKPGDPDRRRANICCPTNVLRTVAEWHNYQYTTSRGGLWVHHYAANALDDAAWKLTLDTDYPWDGEVAIRIEAAPTGKSSLMLRVPNWTTKPKLAINGEPSLVAKRPGTYARIKREWAAGDEVKLSLPMPTRLLEAHPEVEALRNQVAVQRGPLIYCLESPDLPDDVRVPEIQIPRNAKFTPVHGPDLLGGVTALECEARRAPLGDWDGALYRPAAKTRGAKLTVRLIPYYAWANRGVSEMTVWMSLC